MVPVMVIILLVSEAPVFSGGGQSHAMEFQGEDKFLPGVDFIYLFGESCRIKVLLLLEAKGLYISLYFLSEGTLLSTTTH